MANNVTAFFETLVAASGDYNAAKVGRLSLLKGVYLDVKPEVARAGKTLQVYFPDVGPFSNQGANDWNPDDINPNYVDVVFNQRPGKGILVRDFEQWQTAVGILEKFLDPMYKRGMEYFNGQIAGLITEANFNSYSPIIGTTDQEVTVPNAASAWNALAGNKVPVDDPAYLNLFTHNDVHTNMMTDTQWYQENLVGAVIAEKARQTGDLGVAFNFQKRWDQQTPKKTFVIAGTVAVTNGSAAVVGTSTTFGTDVTVGDRLLIAGNQYRVLSITDATHLTLASSVTSTTASGLTAQENTYLSLATHKYAIALAIRPLELVNDGTVQSRIVMLDGIPFRVMLSYQHPKGGWLLTVDCGCGLAVIRSDFGVVIKN